MKRFLKWFVDFLDRKFPDKVTVRTADLDKWQMQMAELAGRVVQLEERLTLVESNLKNVNTAMGFSAPKMGMLER